MSNAEQELPLETTAYLALKAAILTLEVRPGARVNQNDWADRLGISRTPVKEALKRLTLEGLVTAETGRDWRVYTLSLDDVRRLYELREGVETMVARLAAGNMNAEAEDRVNKILARMAAAVEREDRAEFRAADTDFHSLMLELADNPYLTEASIRASEKLTRLRRGNLSLPGRIMITLEENRRIARAMVEKDAEAAAEAQRDHLRASAATIMRLLEELVVPLVGPRF
ncbi:MAG: FCD domain-containing protein [Armatimonadia bacterium]|nr:FCD domain-containing protein [Armatimonadia bacterium]